MPDKKEVEDPGYIRTNLRPDFKYAILQRLRIGLPERGAIVLQQFNGSHHLGAHLDIETVKELPGRLAAIGKV